MKVKTDPRKWCLWHLVNSHGERVGDVWIEVGTLYSDRRSIAQSHGAYSVTLSSSAIKDGDGTFCYTCWHDHLNIQ